jgi:L-seryl-tRNA(Ser) seleniumtransferase
MTRPPAVDALAASLEDGRLPRPLLVEIARRAVAEWREEPDGPTAEERARGAADRLHRLRPGRVINATGVLLHTNLGRASLSPDATAAEAEAAAAPAAVEFDLSAGRRGSRGAYVNALLTALTGAEDALAVNNNAGALLLTLAALAGDAEAVVSRGELIEIGGSFRLPELMEASGARLVEVGTTNRTRVADYRRALGPNTALLLKVHPSNYRIEGFTEEVGYGVLADLAREAGVPFAADLGSGLLDARVPWLDGPPPPWLAAEPAARQTLEAGADVVLFSGDKLLGGPQAGIVVGTGSAVARLRSHPVARALRIDGARLASLAATLEAYAEGRAADLPFWRAASLPAGELARRCAAVQAAAGVTCDVVDDRSLPGAGSVPGRGIPGPVIVVPGAGDDAWRALLDRTPPVIARREERGLVLDLRAVEPGDDDTVADALAAACRS